MSHRFRNQNPVHGRPGFKAVLRWGIWDPWVTGRRRRSAPGPPAPRRNPNLDLIHDPSAPPRITWIGHSSFLATLNGASFLADPVFSSKIAALFPRYTQPGLFPEHLPTLDAVLISHNHYDHLDAPSIRALPQTVPIIVPLGLGRWFRRRNKHSRVIELGWWQSTTAGPLRITLVPARHWSRRTLWDTNRTWWGGYVVQQGETAVYYAGDTAWFEGFTEIRQRFPNLLAAMIPIGAYEPGWFMENNHLNPEQAGEAFLTVEARHMIPLHWGTFQLTDEPLVEPIQRLQAWWDRQEKRNGCRLHFTAVGETIILDT